MFGPKLSRVKYLKGIGYATGEAHNIGDVAEIPSAQARAEIAAGIAEATAEPVGVAPTEYSMVECPRCSLPNSEYAAGCERCGRRFR